MAAQETAGLGTALAVQKGNSAIQSLSSFFPLDTSKSTESVVDDRWLSDVSAFKKVIIE